MRCLPLSRASPPARRKMTTSPPSPFAIAGRRLLMSDSRRAVLVTLVIALIAGGAIWLLVFDMWLGQVERQYLWENARHELRLGPPVSLKGMMDEARVTAARVATAWGAVVAGAIIAAARYGYVRGRIAGALWTR